MTKCVYLSVIAVSLVYCTDSTKESGSKKVIPQQENKNSDPPKRSHYTQFKPDSISTLKIKGYYIETSHQIIQYKLVTGYSESVDGKNVFPDTDNDYGHRLLVLNDKNEIVFKRKGSGDVYLYEPHFYKNKAHNKVVIVCQLAYEYFFGGEVLLPETMQ